MTQAPTSSLSDHAAGWIFYDRDCPMCSRWTRRLQSVLVRRRFYLVPLQSPDAPQRLHVSDSALRDEMHLLLPDGERLGGADAIVEVARHIWWASPLWLISRVPGLMPLLRTLYCTIAASRTCTPHLQPPA